MKRMGSWTSRHAWRAALVVVLGIGLLVASCGPARFARVRDATHAPAIEIAQLQLEWSNVFLVRGAEGVVMVDAGSPGDWDALVDALRAEGLAPRDLRLVVLTHGHADHAALSAQLQEAGVPVAMGRGDVPAAARGHNDELHPTSPLAATLRPLFDFPFTPFEPDVIVDAPIDLASYGVPGARIEPLPGHTPGSLVVWIGEDEVIAGDVMLGGIGGVLFGHIAGEHLIQPDLHRNHCNVERLLMAGAERFYVGHGGPIPRISVLSWREEWAHEVPSCAP